jgi:hypothetical protein
MKSIILCAAVLALAFRYWAFSQLWLQLNWPTAILENGSHVPGTSGAEAQVTSIGLS